MHWGEQYTCSDTWCSRDLNRGRGSRKQHDRMKVNNILQTCKIQTNEENKITRLIRIGKMDKDKFKRPTLATCESITTKTIV